MLRFCTRWLVSAPGLAIASMGMLTVAATRSVAADYVIVASGPFLSATSDSSKFDGTNHGTLPPVLDLAALDAGSFTATFRFSTVTPDPGNTTFYELDSSSSMTFDLFNASGGVVHHGSMSSEPIAIISNDYGGAPFTVDQVLLSATMNSISGWHVPAPIYSPPGDLLSAGDLNFFGNVSGGTQYVNDLSIPTNPATYLAFPDRTFDVFIEFGDGDYIDQVAPYQLIDTMAQYQITSLSVTPVPEAGLTSLFMFGLTAVGLRRRCGTGAGACR